MERKEILRYLNTRSTVTDERLFEIIDNCSARAYETVSPKTLRRIYECEVRKDGVSVGGFFFKSERLAQNMNGCRRVVLFAATLGTQADRLLREAASQSAAETAVCQAVLAAMIEEVCDNLEAEIKSEYGFSLRRRYSPGYFDLDISNQTKIFKLLDITKRIGVTLSDTMQMLPTKSVTAFIGIGEK